MNEADALDIVQFAIWTVLTAAGPAVAVAMIVGVAIALVQALTQVQEITLTFVPKIVAILLVVAFSGPFIGSQISALLLTVLGIMPGLPMLPFFALAAGMTAVGYIIPLRHDRRVAEADKVEKDKQASKDDEERNSIKSSLKTAEIELLIGKQLSTKLLTTHQELAFRMGKMRKKFATQYGFVVPEVRLTDDFNIPSKSYQIKVHGTVVAEHQVRVGEVMVLLGNRETPEIPGEEVREPAFGMRAYSVPEMLLRI